LTHGFVAARSCGDGYTALAAPRPASKVVAVAAVGYYETGSSQHAPQIDRL
jgi:hypothetical protein